MGDGWLGRAGIGTLLVKVAFDHGSRGQRVVPYLCGSKVRPGGEETSINSSTPGGEDRRESSSMVEMNVVSHSGGS